MGGGGATKLESCGSETVCRAPPQDRVNILPPLPSTKSMSKSASKLAENYLCTPLASTWVKPFVPSLFIGVKLDLLPYPCN